MKDYGVPCCFFAQSTQEICTVSSQVVSSYKSAILSTKHLVLTVEETQRFRVL